MKNSIKEELVEHIIDRINDGVLTTENKDEWHFYCFNEDYYIIGYFQAEEWLKRHDMGEFESAGICQEWEKEMFGEIQKVYDNAESVVNMLAYIYG
jgi:L-rhamnose mutarotase